MLYFVVPASTRFPFTWEQLKSGLRDPLGSEFLDRGIPWQNLGYRKDFVSPSMIEGPRGGGIVFAEIEIHEPWLPALVMNHAATIRLCPLHCNPSAGQQRNVFYLEPDSGNPVGSPTPYPVCTRRIGLPGERNKRYWRLEFTAEPGGDVAMEVEQCVRPLQIGVRPTVPDEAVLDTVGRSGDLPPNRFSMWYQVTAEDGNMDSLVAKTVYLSLHLSRFSNRRLTCLDFLAV